LAVIVAGVLAARISERPALRTRWRASFVASGCEGVLLAVLLAISLAFMGNNTFVYSRF
jgi:hypothetical protein